MAIILTMESHWQALIFSYNYGIHSALDTGVCSGMIRPKLSGCVLSLNVVYVHQRVYTCAVLLYCGQRKWSCSKITLHDCVNLLVITCLLIRHLLSMKVSLWSVCRCMFARNLSACSYAHVVVCFGV